MCGRHNAGDLNRASLYVSCLGRGLYHPQQRGLYANVLLNDVGRSEVMKKSVFPVGTRLGETGREDVTFW